MLIIYGADLSAPANKVRFVANALDVEYEYKRVSIRTGENRTPEFLKIHPAGKIPAVDDDGFILFESNAIIKYLADKVKSPLYPQDLEKRANVEQWMDFVSFHIGQAINRVAFNRIFAPIIKTAVDERSLSDGLKFLNRFLPVVENQLSRQEYLAGKDITLADINLLATIDPAEAAEIDLVKYPALSLWRERLRQKDFYVKCHKSYEEQIAKIMTK